MTCECDVSACECTQPVWDEGARCWIVGEKDGLLVAVVPFMFTAGVVIGKLTVTSYYDDRWCYPTVEAALDAARAWTGPYPGSEPAGWHRHPLTGRRVDEHGRSYVAL